MAIANFTFPDFECLGVDDEDATKKEAYVSELGEPIKEDLTSESDTTEEYSSSEENEDSDLFSGSVEMDIGDKTDTRSEDQPVGASADICIKYDQCYSGFPTEIDEDNRINIIQENSSTVKDNESPVFLNLPNLPADGLFGTPINNELPAPKEEEPNSSSQNETLLPANLPNVLEMHSSESANKNRGSNDRNLVYNKHYLPKLEVITEHFESGFNIGAESKGYPGFDRSRHNAKMLRKKQRPRRPSKQ